MGEAGSGYGSARTGSLHNSKIGRRELLADAHLSTHDRMLPTLARDAINALHYT